MENEQKKLIIGLVMPIASIDGLGPDHWMEVKSIIISALAEDSKYEFETRIVSESDSVGLIHKRIVQGLYNADLVICDLSCRNPNVMFELGMRLAFDKPTVIIKDDKTNFTFDTSGIEHIEYPRDLRFSKILDFKNTLLRKTIATYEDSISDPDHSPFLKSFGEFKVAKLKETEVSQSDLIFERLDEIQLNLTAMKQAQLNSELDFMRTQLNIENHRKQTTEIQNALSDAVNNYFSTINPTEGIDITAATQVIRRVLNEKNLRTSPVVIRSHLIRLCSKQNWPYY